MEKALESLSKKAYFISATEKAMEMGSPLLMNMIMIGALLESNLLPMRFEEFKHTLSEKFSDKTLEINLQAIENGRKMFVQQF